MARREQAFRRLALPQPHQRHAEQQVFGGRPILGGSPVMGRFRALRAAQGRLRQGGHRVGHRAAQEMRRLGPARGLVLGEAERDGAAVEPGEGRGQGRFESLDLGAHHALHGGDERVAAKRQAEGGRHLLAASLRLDHRDAGGRRPDVDGDEAGSRLSGRGGKFGQAELVACRRHAFAHEGHKISRLRAARKQRVQPRRQLRRYVAIKRLGVAPKAFGVGERQPWNEPRPGIVRAPPAGLQGQQVAGDHLSDGVRHQRGRTKAVAADAAADALRLKRAGHQPAARADGGWSGIFGSEAERRLLEGQGRDRADGWFAFSRIHERRGQDGVRAATVPRGSQRSEAERSCLAGRRRWRAPRADPAGAQIQADREAPRPWPDDQRHIRREPVLASAVAGGEVHGKPAD